MASGSEAIQRKRQCGDGQSLIAGMGDVEALDAAIAAAAVVTYLSMARGFTARHAILLRSHRDPIER